MKDQPRPPLIPLSEAGEGAFQRFLEAIIEWENRPHNQPGTDKTWVEEQQEEARRHYASAVRVR